jgi:DNA-binding NtrC family response regulator
MKRQHILLIGEKRENALPLCLFLESWNYSVSVIEEGSHFIEQFRNVQNPLKHFDLLLAGTQMPEELLSLLLSEMESRKIGCHFIMISDNGSHPWAKRIRSEYAGVYTVPPSEPQELVNLVEEILKNNDT